MAAATPKRLVHWASEVSSHELGSPYSEASSESSCPTSTMEHVNSQLLAHGFTQPPGLSFDGLSKDDGERIMKCVMALLSQRLEDMSRTEELTTKLRTLSYDHDRLSSMHNNSLERTDTAEKESSMHKSRLATATKALQTMEAAHRHTISELQRTRAAMQSLRLTHAAELKRREKDLDRMGERWAKISDAQVKLGATTAGLTFKFVHVNPNIGSIGEAVMGKGKNLLEQALDDAEQGRNELGNENRNLKELMTHVVNALSRKICTARQAIQEDVQEPTIYTSTTLFPISPTSLAAEKVASLLMSLNEILDVLSRPRDSASSTTVRHIPSDNLRTEYAAEIRRLQEIITDLRAAREDQRKLTQDPIVPPQTFAQRPSYGYLLRTERDANNVPLAVHEEAKASEPPQLDKDPLARAQSYFAKGKAFFEDEQESLPKRDAPASLEDQFLPPIGLTSTPAIPVIEPPIATRDSRKAKVKQHNSPRKSPAKSGKRPPSKPTFNVSVGKAGLANSRRGGRTGRAISLLPKSPSKVIPSFETEVIPPLVNSRTDRSKATQPLILPATFVLPPPSPLASIPPPDILSTLKYSQIELLPSKSSPNLSIDSSSPSDAPFPISASHSAPDLQTAPLQPRETDALESHDSLEAVVLPPTSPDVVPRSFPVAKPFASRMIHAYSPARPSPLSRILMMSQSPNSPLIPLLGTLDEAEEDERLAQEGYGIFLDNRFTAPVLSLEAELGLEEDGDGDSDDSPLKEKNGVYNDNLPPLQTGKKGDDRRKRASVKDNARGRGKSLPGEKENKNTAAKSKGTRSIGSNAIIGGGGVRPKNRPIPALDVKELQKTQTPGINTLPGKPGVVKGGARRVPVGSVDAAPVGRAWRG